MARSGDHALQTIDDASDETQSWAQETAAFPCPNALPKGFTFENLPRRLEKSDFACTGPLPDHYRTRYRTGYRTCYRTGWGLAQNRTLTSSTPPLAPDRHRTVRRTRTGPSADRNFSPHDFRDVPSTPLAPDPHRTCYRTCTGPSSGPTTGPFGHPGTGPFPDLKPDLHRTISGPLPGKCPIRRSCHKIFEFRPLSHDKSVHRELFRRKPLREHRAAIGQHRADEADGADRADARRGRCACAEQVPAWRFGLDQ